MPSVWSPQWPGSCFRGSAGGGGHILGSFRSYFIHNGLGRAEILESEQIFGKSFVHRSSEEASWENPQELRLTKSISLFFLLVIFLYYETDLTKLKCLPVTKPLAFSYNDTG